jgi:luciferase-like monooxygenase
VAEALLDGEAEGLTRKVLEMALAGDTVALRLCLERILPPRRERPVRFRLPALQTPADAAAAMAAIAAAVADGHLTPYYEPFHVARLFATMDLMLKGRAAWNIVTSLNRAEAANFGRSEHMGHDARYDQAWKWCSATGTAGMIRADTSGRAGRSPCRARRRGIRC